MVVREAGAVSAVSQSYGMKVTRFILNARLININSGHESKEQLFVKFDF